MSGEVVEITQATRTVPGKRGGTLTPFDSERARQAAMKRHGEYRRAAERGMVDGVLGEDVSLSKATKLLSYVKIVAKQAEAALTLNDNGTANTAAARFVREAIGADVGAPAKQGASDAPVSHVLIIVSDAVAARMLDKYGGGE